MVTGALLATGEISPACPHIGHGNPMSHAILPVATVLVTLPEVPALQHETSRQSERNVAGHVSSLTNVG